jgi:hypothetical protein
MSRETSYWKQKLRADEAEMKITMAEAKLNIFKSKFKSLADQWASLAKTLPGDKGVRLMSCSNEIKIMLED